METIRTEEYLGVTLEAAAHSKTGEIFLTVDGNESTKRFANFATALDYGKRQVVLDNRRHDPDRKATQLPYLPHSWTLKFYDAIGWDTKKQRFTS